MSMLNINLSDVPELHHLPAGEYKLRIEGADLKDTKDATGKYAFIRYTSADDPDAKGISDFIHIPMESDDKTKANNKARRIADLVRGLGLNIETTDGDALVAALNEAQGKCFWAILNEKDDDTYGTQNTVKKYVRSV
jgi:hypothetical protein